MAKSIGIDLGTTNTVVSIKKIQTEIIKNAEGNLITPSCVAVKKKKFRKPAFIVGKHAQEWRKQEPQNTVTAVKRLMGRSLHNPEVQKLISDPQTFYRIDKLSDGTDNSLALILDKQEYRPEQISSKILEKVYNDSKKYLKDNIEYAVITVPAYFNDKQKHATRTAAALAGLKVRRLLPEPTAAAISFGVDSINDGETKTILVFDFGGGTFDLSVLIISGGQFLEQGKGGNMWLGGEDIDRKIIDHVLKEASDEYDIDDMTAFIDNQSPDLKNRFWNELKISVEQAKILLSDKDKAYIEILGILKDKDGDLIDIDVELTRAQFEVIITPIVESTMELMEKLLNDIHYTPDLIDSVLLVGGSSRIPYVISAVEKKFGKEKVLVHERPMLAIAEGAAILSHRLSDTYECPQCGIIVEQLDKICSKCDFNLEKYIIDQGIYHIVHSAAHDYYLQLENGEKFLFIEKNTPLPCEQTEVFKLVHPDQKLVHMKFSNIVNLNEESIGDLWLGIDENDKNEKNKQDDNEDLPLHIKITLKVDENNLVTIVASLKEMPDVEISKTMSRGKADEKLFLSLEDMINNANEQKYNFYITSDLTSRVVSIIKRINKVLDKKTDEVIKPAYEFAKVQIEKADKIAKNNYPCKPVIYYAESAIHNFASIIPPSFLADLKKKMKALDDMSDSGTYEECVTAYNDLNDFFDELPFITALMTLNNAGEICIDNEPTKAHKFFTGVDNIVKAITDDHVDKIHSFLNELIPEARLILDLDNLRTGTVYKDIKR